MPAGGPCLLYGLPIHTINLYVISGSTFQFLKGIWLADYNISQLSRVFIPKLFGFRESIRKSLADHPAFSKVGCSIRNPTADILPAAYDSRLITNYSLSAHPASRVPLLAGKYRDAVRNEKAISINY